MMDEFEKFIRANKESFDTHKVDKQKLWQQIAPRVEQPKVIPLWKTFRFRVAASILLLIGVSLMAMLVMDNTNGVQAENYASVELMEIDMHYQGLVEKQVLLVKNHPDLSEMDKEEFLSFMEELDEEYELLKLEMRENLDNERILEAIIKNYKKRIELIENLLRQINNSKSIADDQGYIL